MAFFSPNKDLLLQLPQYGQQQSSAMNQLTQMGMQNANLQGNEDLARKNLQQKTIPSIGSRFNSMGIGGFGSSGHMQELAGAGAELESQLAAQRGQFGLQQLQLGLKPQYENIYQPGGPSGLEKTAVASGPVLAEFAGKAGLNWLDNYQKEQQRAAQETAKKTGGQGIQSAMNAANASGDTAKNVAGGGLAALAASAAPYAAGAGAGLGAGYLANKAGVPEDASYGVGGAVGGAAYSAAAQAVASGLAGIALGPVLAWGAGLGLTAYGLKKLYNWWNQANEGNPQRDSLENRMAVLKIQGQ